MPKVSVVILTFNRSVLLKRALKSVLDQTFQDFEIIVVDDCSSDDTEKTAKSFSDSRIRYIRHEENKGEGVGRNDGIRNARGEYIAFLDDDDEWFPEKLRLQVEYLDRLPVEVGAVHCGRVDMDARSGEVLGPIEPAAFNENEKRGNIYWHLLQTNFITLSSIILRNKCFELVGEFDENIPSGLDHDMWIRVSEHFWFEYINQPLVKYGLHEVQLSKNLLLKIQGKEAWLQKYDPLIKHDSHTYSQIYCELGIWHCLNGNISQGRKVLLRIIKKFPRGVKPYAIFCSTFLGTVGFKKLVEAWSARKLFLSTS